MIIIKKENIFDLFNEQHPALAPSAVLPEVETVAPTEPETVAPTEPETVAPTEPETVAPTDPNTSATAQTPAPEPAPSNESEVSDNV